MKKYKYEVTYQRYGGFATAQKVTSLTEAITLIKEVVKNGYDRAEVVRL